jgi:hypothetical protein
MRWKRKKHMDGDIRIKLRFLVFPKRIGADVRWLEYVAWEEKWSTSYTSGIWWATKWISK